MSTTDYLTGIKKIPGPYLLAGILVLYLALSLYQLNLPGLHYDEAFEAVPALQLLQGQPVTTFRDNGLTLGGQTLPLMTQDYIGALNTYLALPFIAVGGATPAALRLMSVLVGGVTLLLAYDLARYLSGDYRVGLLAGLLLAVDPTFIFWNRQGVFVTAITAGVGLAATWCWLHRLRGESARWTLAGAFLFGLGLYAKLLFLWLIFALAGAIILLRWPRRRQPGGGEIIGAMLAFILGCWPLLLYNIQTGGTLLNISGNAQTSYYGVNNLAFVANLLERLRQFVVLLNGSHLWYLGRIISNPLPPLLLGLVLVFVAAMAMRKRSPAARTALFPYLVIGLVILASIGTVSALWVTHFALLMPWPALAIALGSWFLLSSVRPGLGRGIIWLGVALLVITNLVNVGRYHLALAESGGLSTHSNAIYGLSRWLARQADGPVVAMDWGLAAPVTYLTAGQITPAEVFGYSWQTDTQLTDRLTHFIEQPNTLYLWRAPDEIIFDRSQEFKALYRPRNREETIEAAFYEESGRPILGVTRLVSKGTAENPPQ